MLRLVQASLNAEYIKIGGADHKVAIVSMIWLMTLESSVYDESI